MDGAHNDTLLHKKAGARGSWAETLGRFDLAWQRLEARLCTAVLITEVASLTLWIALRGLSTDYAPGGNAAGLLCRSLISAAVLGGAAHLVTRSRGGKVHQRAVASAFTFSLFVAGHLLGARRGSLGIELAQRASGRVRPDARGRTTGPGNAPHTCGFRAARGHRSRLRAESTSTSTCSFVTCPQSCAFRPRSWGRWWPPWFAPSLPSASSTTSGSQPSASARRSLAGRSRAAHARSQRAKSSGPCARPWVPISSSSGARRLSTCDRCRAS